MREKRTTHKRRDEVHPGDVIRSSHGYRLLITEVDDSAEDRTDERHIGFTGHLHADETRPLRTERYPAGSMVEVEVEDSINTLSNIEIGAQAIVKEWADYEDERRRISQELFGHTGAHVGNLWPPTPNTLAAAVLAAVEEARR
jgi:hypothetical protein